MVITCDSAKESISHNFHGVGIFRLNETCKGYATRDVLIPGKVSRDYPDFVPNSTMINDEEWEDLSVLEDKHIKSGKMSDLHDIAISKEHLVKAINTTRVYAQLKKTVLLHDYLIYISISVGGCTLLVMFSRCLTKQLLRHDQRRDTERCISMLYLPDESTTSRPSAPPPPNSTRDMEPELQTLKELKEGTKQLAPLYPKLKTTR